MLGNLSESSARVEEVVRGLAGAGVAELQRVVDDARMIERRTGADHAVTSIREAIERCGLAAVGQELPFDSAL